MERLATSVLIVVLQVSDLFTTLCLPAGAVETNPLIGYGTHPTVARLALFKPASVVIFALLLWQTKNRRVGWLCCGLFAAIVLSNLTVIYRRFDQSSSGVRPRRASLNSRMGSGPP